MLVIPYKFTLKLCGTLYNHDMELWEYMPEEKRWRYYADERILTSPDWLNKPEFEPTSPAVLEKIKKEIKRHDGRRGRISVEYFYDVVLSKNWDDFNIVRLGGTLPNHPGLINRIDLSHIWEQTKRLPGTSNFDVFLVHSWCWPSGYEHWCENCRPSMINGKLVMFGKESRTVAVKEFSAYLTDCHYQVTIETNIIHDYGLVGACSTGRIIRNIPHEFVTPFYEKERRIETVEKVSQLASNIF